MRRRTFIAGIAALGITRSMIRHAGAEETPTTGDCIFVTQQYGEEKYLPTVTHNAVWFDNEDVSNLIYINELAKALDSDDSFFLREFVEDAPTFGDISFAVIGKHDADTYRFQVTIFTGVVIQKLTFDGDNKDALIADSIAMIEAAVARQEYVEEYTDADLFALLLTEEEAGLPVVDQSYAKEQYNLSNL